MQQTAVFCSTSITSMSRLRTTASTRWTIMNSIPSERVAQMHIAGHSKFEKYILDTHDHPVLDPVWKLYARAIERCGPTATLLEWDDNTPSFEEVHAEALKANRFLHAEIAAANPGTVGPGGGARMNLLELQRRSGRRRSPPSSRKTMRCKERTRMATRSNRSAAKLYQAERVTDIVRAAGDL